MSGRRTDGSKRKAFKYLFSHNFSMDNRVTVLTIFVLFVLLILPYPVSSQLSYNSSIANSVYTGSCFFVNPVNPHDPKIACSDANPNRCLMAVYDPTCYGGVAVFESLDGFQTANECNTLFWQQPDGVNCFHRGTITTSFAFMINNNWYPYYHLPYDVVWTDKEIAGNGQYVFYIVSKNKLYRYDPIIDLTINDTAIDDLASNTLITIGTSNRYTLYGFSFDGNDAERLFYLGAELYPVTGSNNLTAIYGEVNISELATQGGIQTKTRLNPTDTGCNCNLANNPGCPDNLWVTSAMGFASDDGAGSWGIDTKLNTSSYFSAVVDACSYNISSYSQNNFTRPSGTDAVHHELGGNLYTINTTTGVRTSTITGAYAGFGTPVLIYDFDESIAEIVNESDSDLASTPYVSNTYIAFNRYSNSTGNGVYVSQGSLITVNLIYETGIGASVSATLTCQAQNYTVSAIGSDGQVQLPTPCFSNENNTITVTSNLYPQTQSFNVSFDNSNCPSNYNVELFLEQFPFDTTFTVRSLFEDGALVENASVNITGQGSDITDSNGKATITDIDPFTNIGSRYETTGTCSSVTSMTATVNPVTLEISKTGYQTYTDNDLILASYTDAGYYNDWTFVTENTTRIAISGTLINVSVESGEGIYFEPCDYLVMVNGSDTTRRSVAGTWTFANTSTILPVLFLLGDTDPYWDELIAVRAPDGIWYNQTLNVSEDTSYQVRVIITKSIDDLACKSSCACPESVCVSSWHFSNPSCSSSTCSYIKTNCPGGSAYCDDLAGCYDADTSIPCTFDTDCPSSCLNNYTMRYGLCGEDGFCKNITQECIDECIYIDNTTGYCSELINCRFGDTFKYEVYGYPTIGSSAGEKFTYISGSYTCDITNVGDTYCLGGASRTAISKTTLDLHGLTINDLKVTPSDLDYVTYVDSTDTYYNFSSVSVTCDSRCTAIHTVCDSGACDPEDGDCITGVGDLTNIISGALPSWLIWLTNQFVLWTLLSLIIGAVLTILPVKVSQNSHPTPEYGLSGMFVFFILGIGLGFVDPFIGLLIVIALGLALASMITKMLGG
jgi:hypothetical protein